MFGWFKSKETAKDVESFRSIALQLLSLQLLPAYSSLHEAFGAIMANKIAAGYVFGFHDALLQAFNLRGDKERAAALIHGSYQNAFGQWGGNALYSMSLNFQDDPAFCSGRMNGGNELGEYLQNKVPPLGLGRILTLGLEA
jgi:hypothetical protein